MTQYELECQLASVTGESLRTIRRRGFSMVDLNLQDFDPEPNDLPAQVLDWDSYQPMPLQRAA